MPSVKKTEFTTVWNAIQKQFEAEVGVHYQTADTIPTFYEQLSEWLNKDNPYKCNSTYLYKEIHLEKIDQE